MSPPASSSSSQWVIGIIGGSGLDNMALDGDSHWETISTQWGAPSDDLRFGQISGIDIVFLPRHGRGHVLSPSKVNYRANIAALKKAGVSDILSLSACGSFRKEKAPGDFVIIDQFIDRTFARAKSFFDSDCVCHIPFAEPVSHRLGDFLEQGVKALDISYHRGGTYLAMEGPQFSTRAESQLYRQWNCDVIGMTNMPEAKLAREAEIPYATIAMVTDYDSWHEPALDIASILGILGGNVEKVQALVKYVLAHLPPQRTADPQGIETILDQAIITQPKALKADFAKRHQPISDRYIKNILGK